MKRNDITLLLESKTNHLIRDLAAFHLQQVSRRMPCCGFLYSDTSPLICRCVRLKPLVLSHLVFKPLANGIECRMVRTVYSIGLTVQYHVASLNYTNYSALLLC